MIFSDKIVVVKRKNYSLQGQVYCENIEEKAKKTNDQPFEFKGWANIWCVELFNGLKGKRSLHNKVFLCAMVTLI